MRIVGSVGDEVIEYGEAQIRKVLGSPVKLQHAADFTGRPATKLFIRDNLVVKLRTDFVFREQDIVRKAVAALNQERKINVHHSEKTWFIIPYGEDDKLVIGNVTPQLTPVHQVFNRFIKTDWTHFESTLRGILELYIQVAKNYDVRLDEGLSNFALDDVGRIYYLDDDVYAWDDFTSLANMIAVWIRQCPDFTSEVAKRFAEVLVHEITSLYSTQHPLQIFWGQLRSVPGISVREQECLQVIQAHLFQTLKQPRSESKRVTALKSSTQNITEITSSRFAVIADVHANAPALESVLAEIKKRHVQQILVLGDNVGYGPHPRECIELLRSSPCLCIQGNHDYAAASGDTERGFSKLAAWAIDWTRGILNDEHKLWLSQLAPVHQQNNWMAVHGAPVDKRYFFAYVYHMTYNDNLNWLEQHNIQLAFHGHSHIQSAYVRSHKQDKQEKSIELDINRVDYGLLCPGSVGQPRGGTLGAEFAIYDGGRGFFDSYSIDYDIALVVEDMRKSQFPPALYERLQRGQ